MESQLTSKPNNVSVSVLWMLIALYTLLLFGCSSLKHSIFESTALDLGIFDQAVYLISQGKVPVSSFLGFHILGDHAAFILYPVALLYWVAPNVYWLFLLQAAALALGAYPTFRLAQRATLNDWQSTTVSVVYLLYPLVFNINLFDFHPDVIAMPAMIWMVLAARARWFCQFCLALGLVLSCKAVLSLTVVAMGLWLILFEQRRRFGMIAVIAGLFWFLIATQIIVPSFGADAASISRHLVRYEGLGDSFSEVLINVLTRPLIFLGRFFSKETLDYFYLLLLPVVYVLLLRPLGSLTVLLPAVPVLLLNVLSSDELQRDLFHQYSLPVLPFLMLAVIAALQKTLSFKPSVRLWLFRGILLWALLAFLNFSRVFFLNELYYDARDAVPRKQGAIATITTQESVLTTSELAPHLSHRPQIQITMADEPPTLADYRYVLLNLNQPGWRSTKDFATALGVQLQADEQFKLVYQQQEIYLFVQQPA